MTARFLWGIFKKNPWFYLLNLMVWTVIYIFPIFPGLITMEFFDSLTNQSIWDLGPGIWIALFISAILLRIIITFLGNYIDVKFRFLVSSRIRQNIIDRLINQLPGSIALNCTSKEAMTYFREDVDIIEDSISWTIDLFGRLVFAISAFLIMFTINEKVVLFVFLPLICIVLLIQRTGILLNSVRKESRAATEKVIRRMGDIFSSIQTIQIELAAENSLDNINELNKNRERWMIKDKTINQIINSSNRTALNIGTGLVLIVLAGTMRNSNFSVGEFALFIYYLTFISDFTQFFGQFLAHYKQMKVSTVRLKKLTQLKDISEIYGELKTATPASKEGVSENILPKLSFLKVQDLNFTYPNSRNGIHNVSFSIEKHTFNVITGRMGSGKSTLLKTIIGLLPKDSGEIFWNGKIIKKPEVFFRPPISAYCPQLSWFVSGTLKENILMGAEENPTLLNQSIINSSLIEDILYLDQGEFTNIGSNATKLSGGQAQRLSIARALYRDTELYILDDVTSSIDKKKENEIWEFISKSNKTFLVVTHSEQAFKKADNIIILEKGRISAQGKLGELKDKYNQLLGDN